MLALWSTVAAILGVLIGPNLIGKFRNRTRIAAKCTVHPFVIPEDWKNNIERFGDALHEYELLSFLRKNPSVGSNAASTNTGTATDLMKNAGATQKELAALQALRVRGELED